MIKRKIALCTMFFMLLGGCSATKGQYLRLVSEPTYQGLDLTKETMEKAVPVVDQSYSNLQQFTRDRLQVELNSGLIDKETYDSTIASLDSEHKNQQNAIGDLKQVGPTIGSVQYGLGIDPGPKRPKSLDETLIPLAVGTGAGLAVGAAAF